jgi:hypothetical protein
MEPLALIVIGLVLIWAAATGRLEAVWKALSGGKQ